MSEPRPSLPSLPRSSSLTPEGNPRVSAQWTQCCIPRYNTFVRRYNSHLRIIRALLAIVTFATSLFVANENDNKGMQDTVWQVLWSISMFASCVLCVAWSLSLETRRFSAFYCLTIMYGLFILRTLPQGPEPRLLAILPVLPLGTIASSFLAYLAMKAQNSWSGIRTNLRSAIELQDIELGRNGDESHSA
ncbi:hypothetical protein CCHR01_19230 [Colletotrichum chrysophilum]|uniref:Uncharacterized protein n=1 Tax=Colletotrichum chrysophilum TaxID=1836956 RepID=A0AAD9A040_9PEZI|nr:hypothetical protein CCHR01_19230 [Colletotrichum chrysophilum]